MNPLRNASVNQRTAVTASRDLGRYRSLLRGAVQEISTKYQSKFDASDIVQQTMLEAYENIQSFQGESEAELTSWLRTMLSRNLLDAIRRMRSQKRNVAKEMHFQTDASDSRRPNPTSLSADQTSPSLFAAKTEDLQRVVAAISRLPSSQAEAVALHHLHGLSLSEVATQMKRSTASVAGLLHRGLRTLKCEMGVLP